jgi:hypothetical protein
LSFSKTKELLEREGSFAETLLAEAKGVLLRSEVDEVEQRFFVTAVTKTLSRWLCC